MAKDTLHESPDLLTDETRNMHRALVSLTEELEAIDAYQQRVDACSDPQLQGVLRHNQNEEIEHATMLFEWVRRHSAHFNEVMRKDLFTERSLDGLDRGHGPDGSAPPVSETLGVGSLKGR